MKTPKFGVATRMNVLHEDSFDVTYHNTRVFAQSCNRVAVTCGGYATLTTVKRINQALRYAGINWASAYRETRDGETRAYIQVDRKWRVDITWDVAGIDIGLRADGDEITGRMPFVGCKVDYIPEKRVTEYGVHEVVWQDYFPSHCVHLYNPRARWQEIRYATPEYSDCEMPYIVHNGQRIYLENFTRAPERGVFSQFDGIAPDSFFSGTVIEFSEDGDYAKVRGYSC